VMDQFIGKVGVLSNYLQDVSSMLCTRQRWTYGATARNKYGKAVATYSASAVRWSLGGAIAVVERRYCYDTDSTLLLLELLRTVAPDAIRRSNMDNLHVIEWLNTQGYDAVMKALERATTVVDSILEFKGAEGEVD
jgi:hypothetical protein